MRAVTLTGLLLLLICLTGCGDEDAARAPACDDACRDEVAVRSMREMIKVIYNITLQSMPVGEHDVSGPCPLGGRARVFGLATSVAEQGASQLDLVYELDGCAYLQRDDEPDESYDVTISGTVTETGILAVQPTATTALIFESEALSVAGTVYDPPSDYSETDCALRFVQNGNLFSGRWCGRAVAFDL